MANRDRVVHCSCDIEGRDGERELGEEGKEVGHEGPVCTVKCCYLWNKWVRGREETHQVYQSRHFARVASRRKFLLCKVHTYFHPITL